MPKVFVEPIGLTLTVDEQENLLDGLVRAQIDIPTDCAGRGTCGKCLVRLGSGELTPPTERELKRIPEKLRAEGWRLACQAYPRSARVSIEVRGTAGQRRILTTSKLTHGAAHPAVRDGVRAAGAADARRQALRPGALRRRPGRRRGARCTFSSACRPSCATAGGRSRRRATASASSTCIRATHAARALRRSPSTSAHPRSSPISSTSIAARSSTRRPSRTRRCATARTSSAASRTRRRTTTPADPGSRRPRGHQHEPGGALRTPGGPRQPRLRHDRGRQHGDAPPGSRAFRPWALARPRSHPPRPSRSRCARVSSA